MACPAKPASIRVWHNNKTHTSDCACAVFTESEEQKFRYFCQHTSSAFRRTFEREKLVAMIEKHENNIRRNAVLSTFLEKIQDSTDLPAVARQIVNAAKKIGFCAGANFYRIEKNAASEEAFLNVSVVLTDTEGEHFVTQIRMGTEIHEKRLDIGRGIPGEVRRQGLAVIVNQPSTTAFFDAEVDEPRDGGNCRNALGVPVFSKEDPSRVIAVLVLFNSLQTTEKGLSDRDFDLEDIDRLHNFAEWIAILLRVPRDIQVPLTTINTILSSVMEGSLGNKVLQEHSKTQESLFLQRQTLNPNLKQFPSREFTFLQRSASWQAISDSITAYTSCQALVAFQLVSGEENSLQCIYPTASAGHRLHVPAGIMKEVNMLEASLCIPLHVLVLKDVADQCV